MWYQPSSTPPDPPAYHQERRRRAWNEVAGRTRSSTSDSSSGRHDYNGRGYGYSQYNDNDNGNASSAYDAFTDYIDYVDDGHGPGGSSLASGYGSSRNGAAFQPVRAAAPAAAGRQQNHHDDGFGGDDLQRRLEALLAPTNNAMMSSSNEVAMMADNQGQNGRQQQRHVNPFVQHHSGHYGGGGGQYPHPSYQYRERIPEAAARAAAAAAASATSSGNDTNTTSSSGEGGMNSAEYFFYPRKCRYDHGAGVGLPGECIPQQRQFVQQHYGQSQNQSQSQSQSQAQQIQQQQQQQQQISEGGNIHGNYNAEATAAVSSLSSAPAYDSLQQQQQPRPQQQQQLLQAQQQQQPNDGCPGGVSGYLPSSAPTNQYEGGANYYASAQSYGGGNGNDSTLRQAMIGVNPNTGSLLAVQDEAFGGSTAARSSSSNVDAERSWAGVGGSVGTYHRPTDDAEANGGDVGGHMPPPKPKKREKRKSKKDNEAARKKQQPDIVNALRKSDSNGAEKENDEVAAARGDDDPDFERLGRSQSKTKKQGKGKTKKRRKATTLLDVLDDEDDVFNQARFDGLEESNLLNAGRNEESLNEFLRLVRAAPSSAIAWTMVFLDRACTTPFLPTAKRYCTDKGPRCPNWNCTCDSQVRAMIASTPLLGAMFVVCDHLEQDEENGDDGTIPQQQQQHSQNKHASFSCFVLPLGPTKNEDGVATAVDPGFERMATWPVSPFICETSLPERWKAFRSILTDSRTVCITYNAAVGLMPFHYHREHDDSGRSMDLIIPGMWDLRLASWLLHSDRSDEELEFQKMFDGFSHLRTSASTSCPTNASDQLIGLLKARDYLQFLLVIYPIMNRQLNERGLRAAFDDIEAPLQSVLSAMECNGIGFEPDYLHGIQKKIETRIDELTIEARNLVRNSTFLLSSPQQVSHLLFDVMRISPPQAQGVSKAKAAGSQHRSTSEEALTTIQAEAKRKGQSYRIVDIVLEFRHLNKLLTTYIRPLPNFARKATTTKKKKSSKRSKKHGGSDESHGILRIHPMWMQSAVRTGRLSCRKPNLQQVPTSGAFGTNPRDSFKATSTTKCLFACDYSQKEIRILAHMSNDQALIAMFRGEQDIDIYKQMAAAIKGTEVEEVTDEDRKIFKQVTLAIIYGMGVPQVAKKLGISRQMAQQQTDAFYRRFHGVRRWMESTKEGARRNHYVKTITGRRRYLDDIQSTDRAKVAQSERQAVNTVIQGSAADLMKLAMIKMSARIMDWKKEGATSAGTSVPPRILLQIHDELVFEVMANPVDVNRLRDAVMRCCADECVREFRMSVPLKLTCSYGACWGTMIDM